MRNPRLMPKRCHAQPDGTAVHIGSRQRWTGLAAGLVLLVGLEGCSTTTSDQDIRRAALWAAATECASGKALTVDRIDDAGQIDGRFLPGGQQDAAAFNTCHNQKTKERLGGAGGASGPAQIVQSPSPMDPSVVHPAARLTSVATQIINNSVLIPVVLNENQPATFLLDTSANITVITPDLVPCGGGVAPGRAKVGGWATDDLQDAKRYAAQATDDPPEFRLSQPADDVIRSRALTDSRA
jgi:hypothetical protein